MTVPKFGHERYDVMRKKEFNPRTAQLQAMNLFWKKGFEASSMDDLLTTTGLSRSSFYNTFGGKKNLFLEVLDKYRAQAPGRHLKQFRSGDSLPDVIRKVLYEIVDIGAGDPQARGCLLVNSIVELSASDEELGPKVSGDLHGLRNSLRMLIGQAQAAGEISQDREAEALAAYLANAISGLRVMSKVFPNEKVLRDAADLTLTVLER